jgi:hemerythrin
MPTIDLDAIPQVATAFQNADHREEAHLLNLAIDALSGDRATADAALDALARHTREHFAREDDAMQRTGFPPYPVHHGEHTRVLAELDAKLAAWRATGDTDALRTYLSRDVTAWFVAHIQSMDFVTARWLAQHES